MTAVNVPRVVDIAWDVVRTESILDRCGPVCEEIGDRILASGLSTCRSVAIVYGRFRHPTMTDAVPHTWLLLQTPAAPGGTTLLDPTLKQFEAGYAPPDAQLATVDASFDMIQTTTPSTPIASWYTPHPHDMEWTTYDGSPIVYIDE